MNSPTISLLTLALMCTVSNAAFRLQFDTDTSGSVTTGGFSGTGTLANSVTTDNNNDSNAITNLGSGAALTLEIDETAAPSNVSIVSTDLNVTQTFTFTGGSNTADLSLNASSSYHKGYNITDLAGVTSMTIEYVFSSPISARDTSPTRLDGFPWGVSFGLVNAGTGLTTSDFDISFEISDLYYSTNPGTAAFTSTLPSFDPYAAAGYDNASTAGTLNFVSDDGFTGISGNGANSDNFIVRGFNDETTDTTFDSIDATQFYATTFSVTISSTTAFASNTAFIFSLDGEQPIFIPEPSTLTLSGIALGLLICRRTRKC